MRTIIHRRGDAAIAEILSDTVILSTADDALEIVATASVAGTREIVVHAESVSPSFFSLRSGLAGEILQKLTNYHIRIAVVCDLSKTQSESLRAFVRESNRGTQTLFVPTLEAALDRLSGTSGPS